jgi:hypothetical protein
LIIPDRQHFLETDEQMVVGSSSMTTRKKNGDPATPRSSDLYTSKIIKAGALLADTKTLLSHWQIGDSVAANIERLQRENIFGKASRSRVEDILTIFKQRYLADAAVTDSLVALMRGKVASVALDRLLYFFSARADRLLYDLVLELLVPLSQQGFIEVGVPDVQRALAKWAKEGKAKATWSEPTMIRISQGLLSTLRDFGVLAGANNKKISAIFLPLEAFAYVAFFLKQHQPSGVKLIEHPDWKLFFLSTDTVERFFFEAHQRHLLEYHVAGSVTRLTFPVDTLEKYAHVLTQR